MSQPLEERPYTVSFFPKLKYVPRQRRAKRAVSLLREFIKKHMKVENVEIDQELNEYIWARGIQKPPRKVKIIAQKIEEDLVRAILLGSTRTRKESVQSTTFEDEDDIFEEDEEEDVEGIEDQTEEQVDASSDEEES